MSTWPAWPFAGLHLTLGEVRLSLPNDREIHELGELAETEIVPPGREGWLPFLKGRPDSRDERIRQVMQHHWLARANLKVDEWRLPFAVHNAGQLVGTTMLEGINFAARRTLRTGSWLTKSAQGRGIGTTIRAMLIEMSFRELGADYMESGYAEGNHASQHVSRKLGYVGNGFRIEDRVEPAVIAHQVILDRERWSRARPEWIENLLIQGLAECRPLLVRRTQGWEIPPA